MAENKPLATVNCKAYHSVMGIRMVTTKICTMQRILFYISLLSLLLVTGGNTSSQPDQKIAKSITVEGIIGPTTTSYIQRAINISVNEGAEVLIIKLDTPGGLLESTRDIVRLILESEVPVAVYVSPEGAGAGSAGVFITMSAHVAAMARATNIGAATPVQMGGRGFDDEVDEERDEQLSSQERKMINFVESYIEGIARRRDRNAEWAKEAVRDAVAIGEEEALELNVIDLVAVDIYDLLEKMDGREVDDFVLNTSGATVQEIPMSIQESVLRYLFTPQVMFILLLVALYGIIGELSNPGAIFPGTVGVISLILLLYATATMPINTAGYILILLAMVLLVSEVFTPAFGLLTAAGAVSFALGAFLLFDDITATTWEVWGYVIPATILTVLFFSFVVSAGLRAQFGKVRSGVESYVGQQAEVIKVVTPESGKVYFMGEYWNAVGESKIEAGEKCEITGSKGLTLFVKPVKKEESL